MRVEGSRRRTCRSRGCEAHMEGSQIVTFPDSRLACTAIASRVCREAGPSALQVPMEIEVVDQIDSVGRFEVLQMWG